MTPQMSIATANRQTNDQFPDFNGSRTVFSPNVT